MPFNVGGTTVISDDFLLRVTSGPSGSRPASPVTGQLWFNTTTAKLEAWNGSAWKESATSGSATGIPPVWSWGYNGFGQLGDLSVTSRRSPVSISGEVTDWIQISSGSQFSLGLRANGTAWAWGRGSSGQLGNSGITDRTSPVSIVGGFTDWTQLSAGQSHGTGIRANGTAWCWGFNGSGYLGNNSTTNTSSPVQVSGGFTDWIQISASREHTCAIRANGTVWSWGYNGSGRLGDNSTTIRSSPVQVVGGFTDWIQISAGAAHSAAIRANGTAWCWGSNGSGRLGDGGSTNQSSPVQVVGGVTSWAQISAGFDHVMAIRTDGTAWGWGNNSTGQLGMTGTTSTANPLSVIGGITNWVQISAGNGFSLAVRTNGTAWSWGIASSGQLGSGYTFNRSSPGQVAGGFTDWIQTSAGSQHSLGMRSHPRTNTIRPDRLRPLI